MDIQSQILEMLKLQQQQQQINYSNNNYSNSSNWNFYKDWLKYKFNLTKKKKKIEILTQVINKSIQICDGEDSFTQNAVWSAIETFKYQPNEDISFEAYFRRYEDIDANDCKNWSDSKKSLTTN